MDRFVSWALRAASVLYLVVQCVILGLALTPGLALVRAAWQTGSLWLTAAAAGVGYLLFGLTYLALIVLIKHLTLFRAREGDYPFLSLYAIRWAVVGTLVGLAKIVILRHLHGMPLLNLFYRLMGARIGRNVLINTCNVFDFDLLEIGDDSFVGGDAVLIGHVGESGRLRLRPIRIGRGCTIGQSAVVFPGAVMEDGATLGALSLLPKGRTLPAGSVWGGNPLVELRPGRGAP